MTDKEKRTDTLLMPLNFTGILRELITFGSYHVDKDENIELQVRETLRAWSFWLLLIQDRT